MDESEKQKLMNELGRIGRWLARWPYWEQTVPDASQTYNWKWEIEK